MQKSAVIFSILAVVSLLGSAGCTKKAADATAVSAAPKLLLATPAPATMPEWDATRAVAGPEGVEWIIFHPGTGNPPSAGATAEVHYAGWLWQGRKFDASVDRHQSFKFVVGKGQVIRGWDLAVADMRPGEYRRIKIPPHVAYGTKGAGAGIIPPNTTLVLDVQLLAVK